MWFCPVTSLLFSSDMHLNIFCHSSCFLKLLPVFSLSFWYIITLLSLSLLATTTRAEFFPHPPSAAGWLICSFYVNFMMNHWHGYKITVYHHPTADKKNPSEQTPGLQSTHQQAWTRKCKHLHWWFSKDIKTLIKCVMQCEPLLHKNCN